MTNHRMSEQLLKQANQFEKLAEILWTLGKTDLAQVAQGMVKVTGALAEIAEKEAEVAEAARDIVETLDELVKVWSKYTETKEE